MSGRELSVADYTVFVGMLLFSALIGVFFAWRDKRTKNGTEGYLMANRSMDVFPVAVSLAVSFQSSTTVLGVPADVYHHGMMYILLPVALLPVVAVASYTFIPTFRSLRISSTYEYLEMRFCKLVRVITTLAYILQHLFYLGINIYAPALALNSVTGFNFVSSILITGLVCIFYTTLGGLKGVIWTDVLQGLFMFLGMTAFIIRGSIAVGGFGNVWNIASTGGRTNILRFETDMRIRYTTWSLVVGGFVIWLYVFGTSQSQVQRYLSVKSQNKAKRSLWFGALGVSIYTTLACICGLVLYAYYHNCDPFTAKCINRGDELMPFAVMDLSRDYNGLAGLYLASVASSSLSTVSSVLNSMVTVTVEDFVKPYTKWTEIQYTWMSKLLGILFGAATLGVSFLASILGDLVTVTIALMSAFSGPSLGIFLLGIWFPFGNSIGAISGFVTGLFVGIFMFMGSRGLQLPKEFSGLLDMEVGNCPVNCDYMDTVNQTYQQATRTTPYESTTSHEISRIKPIESYSPLENFYAISFMYTASVGFAFTLSVGIVISLISCGWRHRHEVDVKLLRPPFEGGIFSKLPDKIRSPLRCGIKWGCQVPNDDSLESNFLDKREDIL